MDPRDPRPAPRACKPEDDAGWHLLGDRPLGRGAFHRVVERRTRKARRSYHAGSQAGSSRCSAALPRRPAGVGRGGTVLAAGAVQTAVRQLATEFAAASGHALKPEFDTVGALRNRVLAGDRADVVILSEAGMAALEQAAKIDPKGTVHARQHGRGAGRAQRCADAGPSLARVLAAQPAGGNLHCLCRSRARGYGGRALRRRAGASRHCRRGRVAGDGSAVRRRRHQGREPRVVSRSASASRAEIVAHADVVLAGRLPAPFDHRTRYVAAKVVGAGPGADAFLAMLQSASGRAALAAIGFTHP